MCQVLANTQVKEWTRFARHLRGWPSSPAARQVLAGYCITSALSAPGGIYHARLIVPLPSSTHVAHWQNLTGFLIDFLYQVDEYIHRILLCNVDKRLRSMHIHRCFSLYGGVFRNKVSLTGMVEVNSLTSAGMVLTSSDSWEASSYIMGSDFRDLGNIKTIF